MSGYRTSGLQENTRLDEDPLRRVATKAEPADVPGVEREGQLVRSVEAVTGDLLHPAQNFTLGQGPPQMSH